MRTAVEEAFEEFGFETCRSRAFTAEDAGCRLRTAMEQLAQQDVASSRPCAAREAAPTPPFEERSEAVASLRAEASELAAELEEQRRCRRLAEAEALRAAAEAAKLREEQGDLLRKLRCAERATMASDMQVRGLTSELAEARKAQRRNSEGSPKFGESSWAPKSIEDVVSALVTLELRQLRTCPTQDRSAAKRKLLLRWHPDKNGVGAMHGGCADLATRIVQEMQSRAEWVPDAPH